MSQSTLADRLRALLGLDPARAAEMGRRGRTRIERELTLEHLAEGHGALYRKALGMPEPREAQRSVERRAGDAEPGLAQGEGPAGARRAGAG